MRVFHVLCVGLLISGASSSFASAPKASFPDEAPQLVSKFSVAKKTQVPGAVLKPGSYSIRVLDHLTDRVVLQIQSPAGKELTTFLGFPNTTLQGSGANGPVAWSAGPQGEDALRGFSFPGGSAVEFVYPKEEAVAIAKVNPDKVAAIDPASQGMPTGDNKLSKNDMLMVNLWLLSTTRVGAPGNSQPAVQAERYQAPPAAQVASTEPAAAPATPPQPSPARVRTPRQSPPASQQIASVKRPAGLSALPHTASQLPAIFLAGIVFLLGAGTLRVVRLSAHEG